MADDTDESPFMFTTVDEDIQFACTSYGGKKKSKLSVSAGIYEATSSVQGQRTDHWKKIVYAKKYKKFLTLHSLRERLERPEIRKDDYDFLKSDSVGSETPFELWDVDGTLGSLPRSLIPTNKPYDGNVDEAQLRRWIGVAKNLGGKPPEHINPKYARFSLRPSAALKHKVDLLYCTPYDPPAYGVTKDKIKAIIAANTGKFDGWPDPHVVDFRAAQGMGLKLVGRNFLQFYFVWMKADYYEELWEEFGVSKLLHELPAEDKEKIYQDVDKQTLKGSRSGHAVDGAVTNISSKTLGAAEERKTTQSIMGASATKVADQVWGKNYITSGMGKSVTVEWLHRVAFALGGGDVFRNLVFGTWECNTDMIRTENLVTELTKRGINGAEYQGRLTTLNKTSRVSRFGLQGDNMNATVPSWAEKYSWLCFSLNYQYVMDADRCPLNGGVAHSIDFDSWSIYVPLSMEPRLDTMILNDLKSTGTQAKANAVVYDIRRLSSILTTMETLQPLPVLPLPVCDARAYARLAREAAMRGLPLLELPDIVVEHPKIARGPLPNDDTEPDGGFVLQGEVEVFGTAVIGELEKWIGPPPEDVIVGPDPPLIEQVVIPGDFHMSMFIPLLRGTPFDKIIFRNVAIYHQNYAFDKTRSIGWHFNADWVIDSSCGLLYDILTTALQVDVPILSIHAAFGEGLQWTAPLNLQSFILEGIFPDLTISPVSGLVLTSIGVRLLGIRGFSFTPEPHSTLSFGFGIFGAMKLDVPGAVVPLNLYYEMGLAQGTVNLRAEISGSIWEDALGVKGLLLEDVVFGTTFSTTSPWDSFAFDVSATFSYLSSDAYLLGSYAAGGDFSLSAEIDNFGTEEIDGLFFALFTDFLALPNFDVHVGSAIISIASGHGLSVSLLDVDVAGYTSASVALSLSSTGVSLSGALSSRTITFGDVQLLDAKIKLSFWSTSENKNVDFLLGGTLGAGFLDLEVTAVVHMYPGEHGVEWAVVAELSAPGRPFAISDIAPSVRASFVDLALSDAVFIAASQDDPLIGQLYPEYDVRQGVHVFGVIERIPPLNDLLQEDVIGLVLNAGWSKVSGFDLSVSLPAESSIDLGNGIKTTPISLRITTDPAELAVFAGVRIPVQDSTPLEFSFVLAANAIEASASAQLETWWVRPFGIDNLKIGPDVTLSIEIVYAQFVSTGTPSGFGVSGGLVIGNTEAYLAMNVSEDPRRQLLFGMLKKLDISDVVTFAGTLVQENIPHIPDNLLRFEELELYICPSGIILGTKVYPQGFSFKADLLLFEKRANIECTIDQAKKSIDIIGGVDNFELGPLTVHGSEGPRATLECHFGASKQRVAIDGVITLFDAKAQTYIDVQFLPHPKFKFDSLLQFTNIFMFRLDAELLGSIHDHLSEADFSLYAEFENDILDYIAQQIIEQFEAAKVAATDGLEAAQEKVNEAKRQWEEAIADAEKKVEAAKKEWESYEHRIRSTSQPVIDHYLSEISRLEGEIDRARRNYDNAMNAAKRAVNQANQSRATALASAQRDVENARRTMENSINNAQRALNRAEAELAGAFGDANRAIANAQQRVRGLENQINAIRRIINDYARAPWWQFWKKAAIPSLWISVRVLETAMNVALLVLHAAHAILLGPGYLTRVAAVEIAREGLRLARTTGEALLSAAQDALRLADRTSKAAVDAAEATLEGVRRGTEFIAFEGAKNALEVFKRANAAAYEAAMVAIGGLMESAEFIAFNAAKAGLEVAKGSTEVLDAAKDALALAENASDAAIAVLEDLVKFGANAVNIKTIILSGTLRGIVGIGGNHSQPLSAVIKGFVLGQWFDIRAKLDPREPVAFITALFKQLWDLVTDAFRLGTVMVVSDGQLRVTIVKRETTNDMVRQMTANPGPLVARRLPHQRPDVFRMVVDKSEAMYKDIPRGPFSGRPIVSPLAVARKTLFLMQKTRGMAGSGQWPL